MMKPNQPNNQMMFAKVINPKRFLTLSVLELATKSIVEAMGIKQASQQTRVHVRKELQMDDPKNEPRK
jgi:hypothetical protein